MMSRLTDTIISLGPSLPLDQAKILYPDGAYHAPLQSGQLTQLLRLQPKQIAIIDGQFEQTASVWHKEILWALSQGIPVYGASSMGALRAAEMWQLGMIPIGQIAQDYIENQVQDDDEVALTYDTSYHSNTLTPMDLKASLGSLVSQHKLELKRAQDIFTQLKGLPYFNRTLTHLNLSSTEQHLLSQHWVNQKQADAKLLLSGLKNKTLAQDFKAPPMIPSVYWSQLYHEVWHAPFSKLYDWLPAHEQTYTQLCTPEQTLLTHYGKMIHLWADLVWAKEKMIKQPSLSELIALIKLEPATAELMAQYFLIDYGLRFKEHKFKPSWIEKMALLWGAILNTILHQGYPLQAHTLQSFANTWRAERKLHHIKDTLSWRESVGLKSNQAYTAFMQSQCYFDLLIRHNNAPALLPRGPLWTHSWVAAIIKDFMSP